MFNPQTTGTHVFDITGGTFSAGAALIGNRARERDPRFCVRFLARLEVTEVFPDSFICKSRL